MSTLPDRSANTSRRLALVLFLLFVLLTVCAGLVYLAGDLTKFQEGVAAKEGREALREVSAPGQLDAVLGKYPSNKILKLVGLASRDSRDIDAAAQTLLAATDPAGLPKPADMPQFSRGDLESLRDKLKAAQTTAATSGDRYGAAVRPVRDKIEQEARALDLGDDTLSRFMAMIDGQHADMTALTSKMLTARAEYFGAYEKCAALLAREFGIYKITNGQFIFPFPSTANTYNAASAAMAAAGKRIGELEDERATLKQAQLDRWKAFVDDLR